MHVEPSKSGSADFLAEGHITYYTTVRGPDILRNVIFSENVTFYDSTNSINF